MILLLAHHFFAPTGDPADRTDRLNGITFVSQYALCRSTYVCPTPEAKSQLADGYSGLALVMSCVNRLTRFVISGVGGSVCAANPV